MEISVALPNANHAQGLVQRLAGALEATVFLDVARKEIRILPRTESPRAVVRVVDVVENWLQLGGAESVRLSLGNRSFTLVGSGQIARSR